MTDQDSTQKPPVGYGRQIVSGLSWTLVATLMTNGFSFVVKMVLVALLAPEHFGLIGMAVVFTGAVATFNELGLGAALIQKKAETLQEIHYHTVFWVTLLASVIIFVAMLTLIGPFIAVFYSEPILYPIVIVLSFSLLLNPFSLIPRVILTRELNFRTLALAGLVASIVSGLFAILLAWLGYGVWSIAWQGVVATAVNITAFWLIIDWRPRWRFSRSAFYDVFSFGAYVTTNSVAVHFMKNIDYLLVGRLLGAELLGIYTLAFILTDTFRGHLMNVLNKVLYPVYGKIQDDPKRIAYYYLQAIKYNSLLIFPIMILFIAYADEIVTLFGQEWQRATFPLQMLALGVMFHAAVGTSSTVLKGLGKPDIDLKIYLTTNLVINLPILFVGIHYAGINGAAVAICVGKAISFVVRFYFMNVLVGISARMLLTFLWQPLLGSLMMLGLANLLNYWQPPDNLLLLIIYILVCVLQYAIVIFLSLTDSDRQVVRSLGSQDLWRKTNR